MHSLALHDRFLSLAPWLQFDGNLQVIPMLRVSAAYALLRPFMSDVPADEMCGAEGSPTDNAFHLSTQYHSELLRARVALPPLSAGGV